MFRAAARALFIFCFYDSVDIAVVCCGVMRVLLFFSVSRLRLRGLVLLFIFLLFLFATDNLCANPRQHNIWQFDTLSEVFFICFLLFVLLFWNRKVLKKKKIRNKATEQWCKKKRKENSIIQLRNCVSKKRWELLIPLESNGVRSGERKKERERERINLKKKVNFEAGGYLLEWEKMKKEE